jgi:predicted RNA-binding Zn ribbon-like protein
MNKNKHVCFLANPSRAGTLDLVGGELALDFVNTSSGRGTAGHQEHLRDFEALMQWIEHARVASSEHCEFMRRAGRRQPGRAIAAFKEALRLRDLIWHIGDALVRRRVVPNALLRKLTKAHAANLAGAEIEVRGGMYSWSWSPRRDLQAAILGPLTLSALSLLMEKDLSRTKRCDGTECGWLFLDATKNKSRRWCEMRVCGNRAKVRRARAKRRDDDRTSARFLRIR